MNCYVQDTMKTQMPHLGAVVRNRHEPVGNQTIKGKTRVHKVGDGRRKKKSTKTKSVSKPRKGGRLPGTSNGELNSKWEQMFNRLLEYKEHHGHCLVPNRYKPDPSLGAWVSTQRRQYKILTAKGSESTPMTAERAKRLVSIGFAWATKDPRHVPWEVRFQELLRYKQIYGDCLVPIGFKDNPQLSNWVSTQRQEYKLHREGRSSRLTKQRVQILESVGFIWEAQRGSGTRRTLKASLAEKEARKFPMLNMPNSQPGSFHPIMPNPIMGPIMPCPPYPFSPPMLPMRPPMSGQAPSFPPRNAPMADANKFHQPPSAPYGPNPQRHFPSFNGTPGHVAGPGQPGFSYPPTTQQKLGRGGPHTPKWDPHTPKWDNGGENSSSEESGSSASTASEEDEGTRLAKSNKNGKKKRRTIKSHAIEKSKCSDSKQVEEVIILHEKSQAGRASVGTLPFIPLSGRGLSERLAFPLKHRYQEGPEMSAKQHCPIKIDDDSDIFADAEEDNIFEDSKYV